MATQTGSIDLKAAKNAHDEAEKVATNYIMTHTDNASYFHAENNSFNPSTGNAVKITDQIDIIRSGESVMAIGEENRITHNNVIRIGKNDETRAEIDFHSLKLIDKEGSAYLHISDLRESDGTLSVENYFTGNGTRKKWYLSSRPKNYAFPSGYEYRIDVAINQIPVTMGNDWNLGQNIGGFYLEFTIAPEDGDDISAFYITDDSSAKVFTFGQRMGQKGSCSFAAGRLVEAAGPMSHAEGIFSTASGAYSHAEGYSTAIGDGSHSECGGIAEGDNSHAEGGTASGAHSHSEGYETIASGQYSHAEGRRGRATNSSSHVEGYDCRATGSCSHAEGYSTVANGDYSHAEGFVTTANGLYSHSQNASTKAQRRSQTVMGEYNILDTQGADETERGQYAFIIGNGTGNYSRSNAFAVEWSGNVAASGNVTDGTGNVLSNKADASNLSTVATSGDYDDLTDKPQINGTTLSGNKTFANLGLIDFFYPVGSYYETSDTTFDPNVSWGGTWVKDSAGKVTVAQDTSDSNFDTIGETGGESTHLLTDSESGQKALTISGGGHTHTITSNIYEKVSYGSGSASRPYSTSGRTGTTTSWNSIANGTGTHSHSVSASDASTAHNNLQPYIVVNRWHRTA